MSDILNFFKTVLPTQGIYCLGDKNADKGFFTHYTFDSLDKMLVKAKDLDSSKKDVYFCTGTLKEHFIERVRNDGTVKKEVRTHDNILFHRALIVDLDSSPTDSKVKYKSKVEALNGLKEFCAATGLSKPSLVESGNGWHCYWSFEEDVPVETWYKLSVKFKALAEHLNAGFSKERTCDKSSVLRVPGTHNHKKSPALPVTLRYVAPAMKFVDIANIIKTAYQKYDVKEVVLTEKPSALVAELFDGLTTLNTPDKDQDLIVAKCAQMKRALQSDADVGYSIRAKVLSIVKRTIQFDYEALFNNVNDEMLARSQADQCLSSSITDNPALCSSFEEYYPEGCKSCPHKGKIKSPIRLGEIHPKTGSLDTPEQVIEAAKEIAEANGLEFRIEDGVKAIPESASPWKHGKPRHFPNNLYKLEPHGVYRLPKDEEAFPQMICPQPFYPYDLIQDERNEQVVVCYAKVGVSRPIELKLPTRILHSPQKISEELCGKGIVVTQKQANGLQEYMGSYLQRLAAELKPTEQFNQLGWKASKQVDEPGVHKPTDLEKFVLPFHVISKEGTVASSPSKALGEVSKVFGQCGSLEEWKKVLNAYNRPGYEAYAFGALTAVGSPLMALTEYSGAIVSMIGDSAAGKSTILRTINSWFSKPDSYLTQADTENSFMSMIGTYGNVAITADEITDLSPERVSGIAYSISQGRSKHRLDVTGALRENESSWKLLLASTSNRSLLTKLSEFKKESAAEAYRVFEFTLSSSDHKMTKAEADDVFPLILTNYGHAGIKYIEYVTKNLEKVKGMLRDTRREVDSQSNASTPERYWTIAVAVNLVGGKIAKELGLVDYNMEAIQKWAVSQIIAMRGHAAENTLGTNGTLASYLSESVGNTLVMCGNGTKQKPFFQARDNTPQKIWNRFEVDNNLMYVDRMKLKSHIVQAGGDYNKVLGELIVGKVVVVRDKLMTLSKGSTFANTGQCHTIVLDTSHESMAGIAPKLQAIDTARTA